MGAGSQATLYSAAGDLSMLGVRVPASHPHGPPSNTRPFGAPTPASQAFPLTQREAAGSHQPNPKPPSQESGRPVPPSHGQIQQPQVGGTAAIPGRNLHSPPASPASPHFLGETAQPLTGLDFCLDEEQTMCPRCGTGRLTVTTLPPVPQLCVWTPGRLPSPPHPSSTLGSRAHLCPRGPL